MPTYTYYCNQCELTFEAFFSIKDYKEIILCEQCRARCSRSYENDMLTINSSVKKGDNELKTIGDLANRNRDRMTDDQRDELHNKHNSYKDQPSHKELPRGMSRIQKPKHKMKWR